VRRALLPIACILVAGGCGGSGLAASGCGGSSDGLAPAAEPARSPPLEAKPAGRVVPVGHKPEGLVFDRHTGLLAVALTRPDRLALVDGRSGRTVRRVRLPGAARHLALARPGGPVLVPAEDTDQLVTVSLPGGEQPAPIHLEGHMDPVDGSVDRIIARIAKRQHGLVTRVGPQPHAAVAARGPAATRGRIFVGNERGHSVSVVENGRELRRLDAPVGPGGLAATRGGVVAVVGVRERAIELFDASTLASRGRIPVGLGPTHVAARGKRFFVVDTRGNGLVEIHTDPLRVNRRTHLEGAPYGIAYDPRRRRFWVTLTALNRVAEVTDRRLLRTFPTVRQPNSVAVDPVTGRVFVASRKDGVLQLLDPPPYVR
jgi:DNA-binding beta-propeller fold protein YncE